MFDRPTQGGPPQTQGSMQALGLQTLPPNTTNQWYPPQQPGLPLAGPTSNPGVGTFPVAPQSAGNQPNTTVGFGVSPSQASQGGIGASVGSYTLSSGYEAKHSFPHQPGYSTAQHVQQHSPVTHPAPGMQPSTQTQFTQPYQPTGYGAQRSTLAASPGHVSSGYGGPGQTVHTTGSVPQAAPLIYNGDAVQDTSSKYPAIYKAAAVPSLQPPIGIPAPAPPRPSASPYPPPSYNGTSQLPVPQTQSYHTTVPSPQAPSYRPPVPPSQVTPMPAIQGPLTSGPAIGIYSNGPTPPPTGRHPFRPFSVTNTGPPPSTHNPTFQAYPHPHHARDSSAAIRPQSPSFLSPQPPQQTLPPRPPAPPTTGAPPVPHFRPHLAPHTSSAPSFGAYNPAGAPPRPHPPPQMHYNHHNPPQPPPGGLAIPSHIRPPANGPPSLTITSTKGLYIPRPSHRPSGPRPPSTAPTAKRPLEAPPLSSPPGGRSSMPPAAPVTEDAAVDHGHVPAGAGVHGNRRSAIMAPMRAASPPHGFVQPNGQTVANRMPHPMQGGRGGHSGGTSWHSAGGSRGGRGGREGWGRGQGRGGRDRTNGGAGRAGPAAGGLSPVAKRQRVNEGGSGDVDKQGVGVSMEVRVREPATEEERQEVERWKAERRKNFPTAANLEKRAEEAEARKQSGALDPVKEARRKQLREVLELQRARGLDRDAGTTDLFRELSQREGGRPNQEEQGGAKGRSQQQQQQQQQQQWMSARRKPSLLEKLLLTDIRRDRSWLLQCIRFLRMNNFLQPLASSAKIPAVDGSATRESVSEAEGHELTSSATACEQPTSSSVLGSAAVQSVCPFEAPLVFPEGIPAAPASLKELLPPVTAVLDVLDEEGDDLLPEEGASSALPHLLAQEEQ
ncbi:hypothetical protein CEUSTIGMA_g8595.t1 [Chlamydomonas eustigma]|uniref:FMR1-interacting protein 1 conserved domain-containing protein n=1 Tax=Chlamydomonas eustigma TaxID=1157962 RepID=A0A250XE37_9CHLO|nr:hypothetical protein CEUSTIGMA_g8595.t1 [Chlamydomonas eustigma]|eukprot:GAX81162.1 hypothetical protein CEUSTIGMA_g8595.t1 [Chlamydomonas eustigma]